MIPFDDWYEHYPNKKSRGAAIKAWEKLAPDEALFNDMVNALNVQKRWRQECLKTGEFCPPWKLPATWLTQQCYLDQIEGTFSGLREQQKDKLELCTGGGKYCTKKAVTKGPSGWLCPWCFSEKHCDMSLLREGYKRHGLGRKEGEEKEDYRKRLMQTARTAAASFGSRQSKVAGNSNPGRYRGIEDD